MQASKQERVARVTLTVRVPEALADLVDRVKGDATLNAFITAIVEEHLRKANRRRASHAKRLKRAVRR